ncbi:AMP-binding protein [Porphyromonas pogonae]|uniref:AMP-binding protein n=1 Tax=Porphyromonas pogonae TaxID=867595 RepID=UPI002E77669C|nr:AMP-binding protein [Porphyromonas pogonae]
MPRFVTDIEQQHLYLMGRDYSANECQTAFLARGYESLTEFLGKWFDGRDSIEVKTSGSTGAPKTMVVKKKRMMNSAMATCSFFGLSAHDRVLLCLPLDYISGMMMVIRALVAQLDLYYVQSSSHPLDTDFTGNPDFRFIAMTPMQLSCAMSVKKEEEKLNRSGIILVGGGQIPLSLEQETDRLQCKVYSSYGMTETLSHIALRKVNGSDKSKFYSPLPGVKLTLSKDDTLIIDAPHINQNILYTNDVALLNDNNTFAIVGRRDNVINSGGIKIHPEKIEEQLKDIVTTNFALTSVADEVLGERLVMLLEKAAQYDLVDLKLQIKAQIPSLYAPKEIYAVQAVPMTETHKINRAGCKRLAAEITGEEK